MKIKLTKEQMNQVREEYLTLDGEECYCINTQREEDEQGKYITRIFKKESENKFFRVTMFLCRYGYEDYGYEDYMQDHTAYEVVEETIIKKVWKTV